jgi:hypothetical protein
MTTVTIVLPRRSTVVAWVLAVVVAVAVDVLAIMAAISIVNYRTSLLDPETAQPVAPATSPPPAPSATPTPEPAVNSLIPAACADLFSQRMSRSLRDEGLELSTRASMVLPGTRDDELQAVLYPALTCAWVATDGAAAPSIHSAVAPVTAAERRTAVARMKQLGMQRLVEHDGVRYFMEGERDGLAAGESHFFRDGLWFATHWHGHGPRGYTADMVRTVFG